MNTARATNVTTTTATAILRNTLLALALASCSSSSSNGGATDAGAPQDDASSSGGADGATPPGDGSRPATDAAVDATGATDGEGAVSDAAPEDAGAAAPTCGPPPNRFTILTGADAGLVRDNVTGLVWMQNSVGGQQTMQQTQSLAATYCAGRGMRLPTEAEALALAGAYAACAFGMWGTWTSTEVGDSDDAWVVDYMGDASPQLADNFPSAVLCVRDPNG